MATEILPDVYDLTLTDDEARYRAFLFTGTGPETLVDTGLPDTTETLFDEIGDVGVDPERVILTHGDVDHVGGLEAVVDRYDVAVYAPEGCDVDDDLVDESFGDGDALEPFTAVATPGHTPEHHVLIDEDADVAVLGDAVFGSDARGLPEGYFVLPTAFYSEDLAAADESLASVLEYEFETGLVFHGSSVTSGASDKLESFVEFVGKP
ncbi:MBL fold metallo-hydrolase [Natrarchaeobaculum aegyptiacum]|uniref:Zn-dependent hydrolase n=1 Tax=Natrarchaeobaculum aegyptiacum TaxID=745377 RepID=A0A2Z2HZK7_9EURY|nr:MBL fold metallo-hydrolase [Natrarchaeobaculum aegyptiacum]ARS90544.1 Zn-dependent hydrolase [Natrarchaeobaculum aegyptiacum]